MASKRVIGTSQVNIDGNNKGLTKSLNDSRSKIEKFATRAKGAMRGFDKRIRGAFKSFGIGATVVAAAAGAMIVASKKAVEALDEIGKGSRNLGITSDAFQELRHAADITGVGVTLFSKSFAKLLKASEDAKDGLQTQVRAFDKMGISVEELNRLNPDQLLERVADGMREVKDPTQQAAIAMQLFGTRGLVMLEFLKEGSTGIRNLRKEARELGLVIDNELIAAAEKNNDTFSTMKKIIDVQWISLWAELAPTIIQLSQGFLDLARNGAKFFGMIEDTAVEKAVEDIERIERAIVATNTTIKAADALPNWIERLLGGRGEEARKELAGLEEELENAKMTLEALNVSADASGTSGKTIVVTINEQQVAYQKLMETMEKERDITTALILEQDALNEAFINGAINSEEFNKKLEENNKKLGITKEKLMELENTPLDKMFASVEKLGEQFETAFVSGVDGAADALTEFATTGTTDVKAMAKSIIADLIKIQIRAALISGIGSIFPGLSFTAPATAAPIPGRARGGPVTAGNPFIVGENGPELMVPRQDGTIVPNNALGGGGTQGNVVVNVTNEGTPQDVSSAQVRSSGDGYIVDVFLRDINRSGPISQGLTTKFSLNRR